MDLLSSSKMDRGSEHGQEHEQRRSRGYAIRGARGGRGCAGRSWAGDIGILLASLRIGAGRFGSLSVDTGCGCRIDRGRARSCSCILGCEHATIVSERGCVERDSVRGAAHLSGSGSYEIGCLSRRADGEGSCTVELEETLGLCFGRSAIEERHAPGKCPNAVRVGHGVDNASDQKRVWWGTVDEVFNSAYDRAWGTLVVAFPQLPTDGNVKKGNQSRVLYRKYDGHQRLRSVG